MKAAISFFAGSALALADFAVLFFYVRRVFEKKQVALSTLAIIFKYLILGLIIYFIMTWADIEAFWFGAGLLSMSFVVVFRTSNRTS
jgi:hypothetical protein